MEMGGKKYLTCYNKIIRKERKKAMKKIILILIGVLFIQMITVSETKNYIEREESFYNEKGEKIYGKLFLPVEKAVKNKKYTTVIISHGFNGSAEYTSQFSKLLAKKGIASYVFEFRGGSMKTKSDMKMTEMSLFTEKKDLNDVLSHVEKLKEVDNRKIFLMGESQGGIVSAMSALELENRIKGLILIYPAFVIPESGRELYRTVEDIPDEITVFGAVIGKKYYMDIRELDIYKEIERYNGKVLIIHGDKDEIVPLKYSEKALSHYKDAELKVIPGAKHGFNPEEFEKAVNFSAEYIKKQIRK